MPHRRLSEVPLPAEKEGQGTEGEPDESRREGDPLRPADRRPRLQLQAQARAELPQGGGQGQGLRLLPRTFDRL